MSKISLKIYSCAADCGWKNVKDPDWPLCRGASRESCAGTLKDGHPMFYCPSTESCVDNCNPHTSNLIKKASTGSNSEKEEVPSVPIGCPSRPYADFQQNTCVPQWWDWSDKGLFQTVEHHQGFFKLSNFLDKIY